MRSMLVLCAALALLGACDTKVEAPKAAKIAPWGFDLAGRDETVKAGDDFFRYSGGGWLKTHEIPPDRVRWGVFDELRAQAEVDVRDIAAEAAKSSTPGNAQKIADFYSAFMNTGAIEQAGIAPAQPGLDKIAAAKTHEDIAALIASPDMGLDGPIGVYITLDEKNPDRYLVGITQSGLSLPDREYYLKTGADMVSVRSDFRTHLTNLMTLAGAKNPGGEAAKLMALETSIAKLHWDIAKRRERELTYNLLTYDALKKAAPAYPWDISFQTSKLAGQKEVVVGELSAIGPLAKLFRATPVDTWKSYLSYQYLVHNASVLPKKFDDEVFDFYSHKLNGQPQQRDRWKRAVAALNGSLGEAVGPIYVEKHFPPDAKAKMDALVENLRKGYAAHIKALTWMSPETKTVALEKLAAFRPKIGYPSKWRSFDGLEVKANDAFGNAARSMAFEWQYEVDKLGKPSDREVWEMFPQTVNAYYNPVFNEVVFPAAILQAPFFDANADPAVNYGGIGGVIGHEMGHGFDDQGAKSDAKGVLRTWWKKEDEDAFKKLTAGLVSQYNEYEPLKGLHVNGQLTLGENIGDLGGLTMAHEAYLISLDGKPAPVLDGLTGDQRFFHGWGQVWRTLNRDQSLRNQIMSDPHSPGEQRVNGVVRNIDAWYTAFDVKEGDKLYLPPEKRVKIW